jgi:prephenate dehydrogenase
MENFGTISNARVAILGMGLMGGSLALALRGNVRELRAADPDLAALELARQLGVVHHVSVDPSEVLPGSDIVILAAPVHAILELIRLLPDLHPGSPVVLDLGSTKSQVCRAMEALPERFDPIGGHPMCGKETSGLRSAEADIFKGATFALSALGRTSQRARDMAEQIARVIDAVPLWIEPEVHDRWVAATSHVPYLLANALSLATPIEATQLVGPGFRSTSRLAASFAPMMLDVLASNQENIHQALRRFRVELDIIESTLAQKDYALLEEVLARSAEHHTELVVSSRGSVEP